MNRTTRRERSRFGRYCEGLPQPGRFCVQVADACNVSLATVYRWQWGEHQPESDRMAIVERLTRGAITLDDWAQDRAEKRSRTAA